MGGVGLNFCGLSGILHYTDGDDGSMFQGWLYLPDWLMITLIAMVLAMFCWCLVASYAYYIDFEDGMIKTEGDRMLPPKLRLQFKQKIKIKDITAIRVIKSNYNSLKKSSSVLYNKAPATYFEFTLSNGRTKWLYIHTYSKKQRIKMINIINGELIKGGSIFNREKDTKK